MPERKLKVVKRTPIALASCERCHAEFHSDERVEDDAEREMQALFDGHHCEDKNKTAITKGGNNI